MGRYALRATVDLAAHRTIGPVQCRDIASRQEISDQYLSQLLLKLRRAGLVESSRGPGGGYVLARDASEISAADVLEAVDEALTPVTCAQGEEPCTRAVECPTHWLWDWLGLAIHQVLESVTVADLLLRGSGTETDEVTEGNSPAGLDLRAASERALHAERAGA